MNWLKENFKKYLPDLLFLLGVWIASYGFLIPPRSPLSLNFTDYHTDEKVWGIMLVALAADIFIRRYISKR